jgi:nucleotide-binding universal stress UspA family protein
MKMNDKRQSRFDSILLAVDGSLSTKSTAYAAVQIASAMHCSIHAEYVVDVTQVFDTYGDSNRELSELGGVLSNEQQVTLFEEQGTFALAEIDYLCQEMNIPLTTEMVFGGIPDMILESSKQYKLLALGRRGNRHERASHYLGSNFRQIAHHIHIPLLIGGSANEKRKIRHVLLAYDGSRFSRTALSWIESLQWIFEKITVLSVENGHEKDHTWLEERQKEIMDSNLSNYEFVREEGEPGLVIASTALSRKADLILTGSYQHGPLLEWAGHSVLDAVLREVNLPILATK